VGPLLEGQALGAMNTSFVRKENIKPKLCGINTGYTWIREAITQDIKPETFLYAKERPDMVMELVGLVKLLSMLRRLSWVAYPCV